MELDWLQIIVTSALTGLGTGAGIAIGTYFANKALIKNMERIADVATRRKESNGVGDNSSRPEKTG